MTLPHPPMADTPITSVTSHASLRHPESTFNHARPRWMPPARCTSGQQAARLGTGDATEERMIIYKYFIYTQFLMKINEKSKAGNRRRDGGAKAPERSYTRRSRRRTGPDATEKRRRRWRTGAGGDTRGGAGVSPPYLRRRYTRRRRRRTGPTQRRPVVDRGPADIKPAAGAMDRRRSGQSQSSDSGSRSLRVAGQRSLPDRITHLLRVSDWSEE
jgi:hypothetical protein